MAIYRENISQKNFSIISNSLLRDSRLTFKARGLLAYMLSHSDEWQMTIKSIAALNGVGRDQVSSALVELEKFGYARRSRVRNEDGTLGGSDWYITDTPSVGQHTSENPAHMSENPHSSKDYPVPDNPTQDYPAQDIPALKKTNSKKTKLKENQSKDLAQSANAPQASPTATSRGCRVPEDFMPAQKHIDKIRQLKPGLDLKLEHTKFMNHWLSSTGRNATKKDWGRAWENWMLNAREAQGYKPGWQKRLEYNAQLNQQYQDPGAEFLRSIEQ